MRKLVVLSDTAIKVSDRRTVLVPCTLNDELKYTIWRGEEVLIARKAPDLPRVQAIGRLVNFTSRSGGNSFVVVGDIRVVEPEVPLERPSKEVLASGDAIFEISVQLFESIVESLTDRGGVAETATGRFVLPFEAIFSTLSSLQQERCCFSGVRTYHGTACAIRPIDQGGDSLLTNYLFLDAEPAALFSRYAWSVGPQYENLINAAAMTGAIAATVNEIGVLALSETIAAWPDRDALAWHRAKFIEAMSTS